MLTESNMKNLGFNQKLINMAVAGNLWVDRLVNAFDNSQHGMPESTYDAIMNDVNNALDRAVYYKCVYKGDEKAARWLGIGLHTL